MLCLLLYLCLVCFNLFYVCCSSETITLYYFDFNRGRFTQFYFGEPAKPVLGIMSLSSQYTILTKKSYKRELSQTFKMTSVNKTMSSVYDIFQINKGKDDSSFPVLSFYCLNNEAQPNDVDVFGFSYKFDLSSFSIIHQLYDKGLINYLGFGLSPIYDEDQGDLYLGKLPSYVIDNKEKLVCDVNTNYNEWNCKLRYIYIENDKYKGYHLNNVGIFVSDRREIVVGKHLWDFVVHNIFEKYYFGNNTCEYDNKTDSIYQRIKCECINILYIPKIYIIIGKSELMFKAWDLFQSSGRYACDFQIIYDSQINPNSILLGTSFYSSYFIYFNYQLNQIEMLSYQKILPTELDDSFLNQTELINYKFIFLMLLVIILSIMSLFLLYCKLQKPFY